MKLGDLERPELGQLDWSVSARRASLSKAFDHAVDYATGSENWYAKKRRWKKGWGRLLRIGAILLGATAVVLPILSEIFTSEGEPVIAPAWASVALAVAAALVALDHYFGFSAGWMRFMATELKLTNLRHDFEYDWQPLMAKINGHPSDREVSAALARAQKLVYDIDLALAEETEVWIREFQSSLDRVEKSTGHDH